MLWGSFECFCCPHIHTLLPFIPPPPCAPPPPHCGGEEVRGSSEDRFSQEVSNAQQGWRGRRAGMRWKWGGGYSPPFRAKKVA